MQTLILPFEKSRVVAGYKTAAYRNYWGYHHYGVDYKSTGSLNVLASGKGTVVTAGYDNAVGNTVCVVYEDVLNHSTGKSCDLVARYMHLKSIAAKVGQAVKAGDVLGVEGKTGSGGWSEHLHIEFDTDTRPAYYNWSPQVKGSNLIKKGTVDSSVNPSHLFHRGESQTLVNGGNAGWTTSADWNLPMAKAAAAPSPQSDLPLANQISILRLEIQILEKDLADARKKLAALESKAK